MRTVFSSEEEDASPHGDLLPGEWQMWCKHCHFRFPKCAAAKPVCPDCNGKDTVFLAYGRQSVHKD